MIGSAREKSKAELLEIVHALDALGAVLGFADRREQKAGENRDNGNDDQQFDQRKREQTASFHR
jgi:hypothetical protein